MRNKLNEQVNRFKQIMNIISENTSGGIDFIALTGEVIDKLEGGYYHPDMRNRLNLDWSKYGSSGETMFGIDRLRGGSINNSAAGREFWKLIDSANARNTWKLYYRGGALSERLKVLAAKMMKPQFELYMRTYLTPEAQKIVYSDKALTFNFIYATWNGPGWFQRFAKNFNEDVKKNLSIPELINKVLEYRRNSGDRIIVDTGKKLENILGGMEVAQIDTNNSNKLDVGYDFGEKTMLSSYNFNQK